LEAFGFSSAFKPISNCGRYVSELDLAMEQLIRNAEEERKPFAAIAAESMFTRGKRK
jgi:hypothetical protein